MQWVPKFIKFQLPIGIVAEELRLILGLTTNFASLFLPGIVLLNFTDYWEGENLRINFLRNHFSLYEGEIFFIVIGKMCFMVKHSFNFLTFRKKRNPAVLDAVRVDFGVQQHFVIL